MRALHSIERRLQDIQRQLENKERLGKIVDVKFENQRWYVKLNDGSDDTPSGSQSGAGGGGTNDTFKSDWQPWKSFSHGTIKMSVPPKKGQYALMRSVGGQPELSTVEPHHYGPENPSPHDKEHEIVKLIEDDDDDQQGGQGGGAAGSPGGQSGSQGGGQGEDKWNSWLRETKDTHHLIIRKKESQSGGSGSPSGGTAAATGGAGVNQKGGQKQQKSRKIPEIEEDGDDKTTQIKSTKDYILKTVGKKKSYYRQDNDKIHVRYGEQDKKADILMNEEKMVHKFADKKATVTWTENDLTVEFGENKSKMVMTENDVTISQGTNASWKMSDGKLEIMMAGVNWILDANGWKQDSGNVVHDMLNIGSSHKHKDVTPGPGLTGVPIPMSG
jgi:hypothetical protein